MSNGLAFTFGTAKGIQGGVPMRSRTSGLIRFTRRGSVTRFLTVAIASALAVPIGLGQTTPGTTTTAPATPAGGLPPVNTVAPVPEAVLKTPDAPAPASAGNWLRISGNTVNVRARPDTNGLSMTRLERDAIVWGVRKENGWWAISPPPDVFSLIAPRFVERRGSERGMGKVEPGRPVGGRARSRNVQVNPQETDVQTKIGTGQEVRIVGEVTSGAGPDGMPEKWLQIAPPEGVLAYISSEYAEPISDEVARSRGATKPGMTIAAAPSSNPPPAPTSPSAAPTSPTVTPSSATQDKSGIVTASDTNIVPSTSSPWARRLQLVEAEIDVESKKPTAEQSWSKSLAELR